MEQTPSVSDAPQASSGSQETDVKQQYEQDRKDGLSYESYRKAVGQYKSAKEKIAELESRLNTFTQDKMATEGKKDEVISQLRAQLGEMETKYKQNQAQYTWNVVGAQIKSEMAARGINNPDRAFRIARIDYGDDLKGIEVDEDYNVNRTDMQRFVDRFLEGETQQGMSWVQSSKVDDLVPGKFEKADKKAVKNLSDKELRDLWNVQ